ncbi:DUF2147 domain-containing protein [Azotobacter chroococcum]|uniref:DUF2147 domain-containing protein n=1 Tax=Azotobacter chroococcum TaxID=353 RepID=UPI00103A719C|nr:DUF2147 domain-containing protein [Azotobacter chroococcum]TBW37252.1 DUF2147 domain-containing protein [Azotobacter chroococcum]
MNAREGNSHTAVRRLCVCCALVMLLAASGAASATASDPLIGLWMIRDERTGEPRALVRIAERGDEYQGTIEKGLRGPNAESHYCDKCEGERRGRPLLGMTILSGVKKRGEVYGGGEILDPDSGKVYDCRLTLQKGGKQLQVRGFIGTPLLGETRTWYRVDQP